ncbi:hypothetical protein HYW44_00610 [Candidatus Daviesbacteria bacterium]|nr:hypothetical protein [Candidatus Daviesbacteria bacterium]
MEILPLFVFSVSIAFLIAKLEINIEGKHGWAKNLPTWRIKNKWTKIIMREYPLTGYHLYLMLTVLSFLHFPFFFETRWSLSKELITLGLYFFIFLLEDFFWFVLNPHFGLKKFHKDHIDWHHKWVFNIPIMYFNFLLIAILFFTFSQLI